MNNARDTFGELRGRIDGNDPFMTSGHQIHKVRRYVPKKIPKWTNNNKTIQAFLLRSFPKLRNDDKQRRAAARWARVITLYFKAGWTRGQIAEELETTPNIIRSIIQAIRRVAEGRKANGTGYLGAPKGRPKKRAPTQTSLGDVSPGPHEDHRKVGAGAFV